VIQTNLAGRLRNTRLPRSQGLLPLFEAVVNSIHAIDALGIDDGVVRIQLIRSAAAPLPFEPGSAGGGLPDVEGFRISDNGEGFNAGNRTSFETLDSDHKVHLGCRGVGRLLWLKAFGKVEVLSQFKAHEDVPTEGGQTGYCAFDFDVDLGIVDRPSVPKPWPFENVGTQVSLLGMKPIYRERLPKTARTIAQHLMEHVIWYFVRPGGAPRILVQDDSDIVSLESLFAEYVRGNVERDRVCVSGVDFDVLHLRFNAGADGVHRLYWCAGSRVAESEPLAGKLPGLYGRLRRDGHEYTYGCYVSGSYLDEHVRPERTALDLEPDDNLFAADGPTLAGIREAVLARAEAFLGDDLVERRLAGRERVEHFVAQKAPRYRPILAHLSEANLNVDPDISDKDLEMGLHRSYRDLETGLIEEGQHLASVVDVADLGEYQALLQNYVLKVDDLKKSDLANYVFHRKVVLDIFQRALQIQTDGSFTKEEVIHRLILPLRTTSNDTSFATNNLWLIDERLAFHNFLASDRPLSQLPITGSASAKEPDIVALNVYDEPVLVSEGQEMPLASIVVVELKRPMRNDAASGEAKDPIEQALGYLKRVRDGGVKTASGRPIPSSPSVPGFCYVICDITPTVKARCELLNLRPTADYMGYFGFNDNFKAYIEVLSYDRILTSARQRNRAFFDQLGLPASSL
jgi:hypothetical protein